MAPSQAFAYESAEARPARPGRSTARSRSAADADAELEGLVTLHLGRLIEVAERILGSREQADDAVQEALVTLWKSGVTPSNPRGWLVRAVVHRSLHARRTAQRRRKWEERAGADWTATCPLCDPSESAEGRELLKQLDRALAGLSDDHRIVLALRAEGLEYPEIARRLGVPVGTVRSRLKRARDALRADFGSPR